MVRNPVDWLNGYKVGQDYRFPGTSGTVNSDFQIGNEDSAKSTWVYLFGNGTYDQFHPDTWGASHTGIVNYVSPVDESSMGVQTSSFIWADPWYLFATPQNTLKIEPYNIPTYQEQTFNLYENQITLAGEVYTDSDFTAFTGGNKRVVSYAVLPRQKTNGQYYSDFIPINAQSYLSTSTSLDYCSAFGGSCNYVTASSQQTNSALNFDGYNVDASFTRNPLHRTGNSSNEPWALAITFNTISGNSSNIPVYLSHGAGPSLRIDQGKLMFTVGGSCAGYGNWLCFTSTKDFNDGKWHAIYIDYDGGNTDNNTGNAFRVKEINLITGEITEVPGTWTDYLGGNSSAFSSSSNDIGGGTGKVVDLHIGHRLTTTLKQSYTVSDAEIVKMLLDPVAWINEYKVNETYRREGDTSSSVYTFSLNDAESSFATQLYLMGNGGTNDWSFGSVEQTTSCSTTNACFEPEGSLHNYVYPDHTETQLPLVFVSDEAFYGLTLEKWSATPSAYNWMADALDPATNADILTNRFSGTTNEVPEGTSLWYQVFNPDG